MNIFTGKGSSRRNRSKRILAVFPLGPFRMALRHALFLVRHAPFPVRHAFFLADRSFFFSIKSPFSFVTTVIRDTRAIFGKQVTWLRKIM